GTASLTSRKPAGEFSVAAQPGPDFTPSSRVPTPRHALKRLSIYPRIGPVGAAVPRLRLQPRRQPRVAAPPAVPHAVELPTRLRPDLRYRMTLNVLQGTDHLGLANGPHRV